MKDIEDVEEATWNEVIAEVDEDGSGQINFKAFTKMMMRLVDPDKKTRQMTVQPKLLLNMMESSESQELSVIKEDLDGSND